MMSKKDKPAVAAPTEPSAAAVIDPIAAVAEIDAVVAAEAAPLAISAEMEPPKPGEQCKLCGHMNDDKDEAKTTAAAATALAVQPAAAAAAAPAAAIYGEAEIRETMEVCQLAKLSLADTQVFIQAKTPVAKVRDAVIAKMAARSDALQTTATPLAEASSLTGWDNVAAKVNKEFGVPPK